MDQPILITRRVIVGEVQPGVGKKSFHEAVLQQIGADYQTVHWNEKADGVSYDYNDGDTDFTISVEAKQRPESMRPAEAEPEAY
jgi:hypothetical protein